MAGAGYLMPLIYERGSVGAACDDHRAADSLADQQQGVLPGTGRRNLRRELGSLPFV
jgi:hypothetical protein